MAAWRRRAAQVCERAGLVRESVYVLGRMGCAEKALRLIVEGLRDVAQAVEFVQLQVRAHWCACGWLGGWLGGAARAAAWGWRRRAQAMPACAHPVRCLPCPPQRDDELWEPLIALTLGDAQLTGARWGCCPLGRAAAVAPLPVFRQPAPVTLPVAHRNPLAAPTRPHALRSPP